MNSFFEPFIASLFGLFVIIYMLVCWFNIWIYYYSDRKKYKYFPFMNPLSISTYELFFKSFFTFSWIEIKDNNNKLRKIVNKLSIFLGILILTILVSSLIYLFIYYAK